MWVISARYGVTHAQGGVHTNWAQWRQASPKRSQNILGERFFSDASAKGTHGVLPPAVEDGFCCFLVNKR